MYEQGNKGTSFNVVVAHGKVEHVLHGDHIDHVEHGEHAEHQHRDMTERRDTTEHRDDEYEAEVKKLEARKRKGVVCTVL